MKIQSEEIIAALTAYRSSGDRPPGVFTVREGAEAAGMSTRAFSEFLHRLKRDGRLDAVPTVVDAINGRQIRVIAYRIKPVAKLKRA